jgi:hypothetical protein
MVSHKMDIYEANVLGACNSQLLLEIATLICDKGHLHSKKHIIESVLALSFVL